MTKHLYRVTVEVEVGDFQAETNYEAENQARKTLPKNWNVISTDSRVIHAYIYEDDPESAMYTEGRDDETF